MILGFPFLPLKRPVEFGPWWLGPLEHFGGEWFSPELETLARRLLGSFRHAFNAPIEQPSILVRRQGGVDGQHPTRQERRAITATVGFAVIEQNPYWSEDVAHAAWRVGTTDNADLWIQPLLPHGAVALGTGYRVSTTSGGWNINDEGFCVASPLELHMPRGIRLDAEVARPSTRC